jgi:hypothetical protein
LHFKAVYAQKMTVSQYPDKRPAVANPEKNTVEKGVDVPGDSPYKVQAGFSSDEYLPTRSRLKMVLRLSFLPP